MSELIKVVNFPCTANEGRSKPSEIFGNIRIAELGLDNEYLAISSGTSVDAIAKGDVSQAFMLHTINMARDGGEVYSPVDMIYLDQAIKSKDDKSITHFYDQAANQFATEEHHYRDTLLTDLSLIDKLKKGQDQTVARPDAVAVLSMAKRNNDQVAGIHTVAGYQLAAEQPEIGQMFEKDGCQPVLVAVLRAYALQDPNEETLNAFGKDRAVYEAAFASLREDVPRAIDMLLG